MPKKSAGFTLIELLVTIAIIAVISTVGMAVYGTAQKTARISKRAQDLKALRTSIELYKSSTGFFPSGAAINTFNCVVTNASGSTGALSVLTPTYMTVIPADPLDGGNASGTNCYQYASNVAAPSGSSEFKLRTNSTISNGGSPEMTSSQFQQQPTLIDSQRDGGAGDNCLIQPTGTILGWAVYSGSGAICNL